MSIPFLLVYPSIDEYNSVCTHLTIEDTCVYTPLPIVHQSNDEYNSVCTHYTPRGGVIKLLFRMFINHMMSTIGFVHIILIRGM